MARFGSVRDSHYYFYFYFYLKLELVPPSTDWKYPNAGMSRGSVACRLSCPTTSEFGHSHPHAEPHPHPHPHALVRLGLSGMCETENSRVIHDDTHKRICNVYHYPTMSLFAAHRTVLYARSPCSCTHLRIRDSRFEIRDPPRASCAFRLPLSALTQPRDGG